MHIIEVNALSVKYPGRKQPVLRELSLQVNQGETLLLLGPSGSGKSTLALTLNGLVPQSIGEVLGGGVRVHGMDTQEHAVAELAQQVGIVFQDPDTQFATMKVEDEVVFGLENLRQSPEQMESRLQRALEEVDMLPARQRPVWALSGGEKQRVALASLLAMHPSVLVFDEPTANLDPVGTQAVFALLAELKSRGKHTLILIEHKLDELMHLVDRVVVLDARGQLLADGPPRKVFSERGLELKELGVWMPQVSLLALALQKRGQRPDSFPITIGEAVKVMRAWKTTTRNDLGAREQEPSTKKETAFDVRDLSFSYGETPALNGVSLQVERGDFLAIVGANGAGKTTLAKHLIGILTPPAGSVYLNGKDLNNIPAKKLASQVGYVFQNPEHQFVTESVFDEIAYGLRVMGEVDDKVNERTEHLLTMFGLARYAKANPFTLSFGEKRRLSVAAMLAMGQQTLILDEPTFGQDERNAAALLNLLDELNAEGKTIIVVTHDMRVVAEYARQVAVMAAGELIFAGKPRDLFSQPELLARARLNQPPLARLAALLAQHSPQFAECLTMQDFLALGNGEKVATQKVAA
ncbi:MAG: energy-coupling factor transporter ATPase [Anaerolineales bacterium]